jgi:polar amino acid transport system ATP-binding protein
MLFLDEPTGDVDPVTAGLIVRILRDLRARRTVTCLIISHHTGLARELGCSVRVLDRGNIVDLSVYNNEVDGMFPEVTSFPHGAV